MERRREFGRGPGNFSPPPVSVGEEMDVKIEAVGEKGDGIAKKNGFVLFVPNVKEGEEVRIRVTKVLRRVGFAEVIGKAEGKVSSAEPEERNEEFSEEKSSGETDDSGQDGQGSYEDSENFGDEEENK